MLLIDGHIVPFGKFPNGERHLNHNKIGFSEECIVTLKYESDQDLLDLYILKRYMDYVVPSADPMLIITYMPYSRMDRENQVYTFNLKYVCDFINSMKFSYVEVYDAHSDVTLALLDNVFEQSIIPTLFTKFLRDLPFIPYGKDPKVTGPDTSNLVIMYPDAGAQKRYSKSFNYPTVIGSKERDFTTGAITKFNFYGDSVEGKTVVIIDDLCSKGGTFVGAAEALRAKGATKVCLIVAHCEDTIFDGDVFLMIDKVFTSNSILKQTLVGLKMDITELYEVKNDK